MSGAIVSSGGRMIFTWLVLLVIDTFWQGTLAAACVVGSLSPIGYFLVAVISLSIPVVPALVFIVISAIIIPTVTIVLRVIALSVSRITRIVFFFSIVVAPSAGVVRESF